MSHPPSSPRRHPRIGGLFFGYGGLDLAVQSVIPDAELAWYSEFDKGANKIAAHRFPDVPNHGDITKIDWSQVEPIDILTGGSPCQDLSHAGRRAGMTEGTRSNLWVAMREAIAQLRPGLVVWENVRGAYSAGADSEVEPCPGCVGDGSGVSLRALGRVLGDLSDLGYDASWHGLRAADIGAPHGRFRVFVVATDTTGDTGRIEHGDGGAAADASMPGRDRSARRDGQPIRDGERPSRSNTDGRIGTRPAALTLLPTPRAGDGEKGGPNQRGSSGDFMLPSAVTHLLPTPAVADALGGHATRSGVRSNELLLPGVAAAHADGKLLPTPMAGDAKAARNSTATRHKIPPTGIHAGDTLSDITYADKWGQYGDTIRRWEAITGTSPAPTEPGPKGNPRLSAAFSEWMMGLPAGWVTDVPGITRNEALKALGNGVVPQQAAAALREMFAWTEVAA